MSEKRGFRIDRTRGDSKPCVKPHFRLFSKRGQITIFIIVGIVILLAFAGFLYVSKNIIKEEIKLWIKFLKGGD